MPKQELFSVWSIWEELPDEGTFAGLNWHKMCYTEGT